MSSAVLRASDGSSRETDQAIWARPHQDQRPATGCQLEQGRISPDVDLINDDTVEMVGSPVDIVRMLAEATG